jgi:hypothetical protein
VEDVTHRKFISMHFIFGMALIAKPCFSIMSPIYHLLFMAWRFQKEISMFQPLKAGFAPGCKAASSSVNLQSSKEVKQSCRLICLDW